MSTPIIHVGVPNIILSQFLRKNTNPNQLQININTIKKKKLKLKACEKTYTSTINFNVKGSPAKSNKQVNKTYPNIGVAWTNPLTLYTDRLLKRLYTLSTKPKNIVDNNVCAKINNKISCTLSKFPKQKHNKIRFISWIVP